MSSDIHSGQPVLFAGTGIKNADLAVILLHGRGATAESMLPLVDTIRVANTAFIIPQAALNRWYPQSAFAPLEANQPDLSSALGVITGLVKQAGESGLSDRQIVFGGFSQGACLASEYAARNAGRYGGLFVLSGALIGPKGTPRDYPGSFEGMPVFIGGSDIDPWVSHDLMENTASVFRKMGAEVDFRTYTGMAHTVNQDEIDGVRSLLVKTRPQFIDSSGQFPPEEG